MDSATLLRVLRDKLVDVDPATELYTDEQLMVAAADALRMLAAKKVNNMSAYTVITDINNNDFGFSPEPTDADALVVILKTAADVLSNEFRGRVKRGELGVSWKSGLEEESSIQSSKAYQSEIQGINDELTSLIVIQASNNAGSRIQ